MIRMFYTLIFLLSSLQYLYPQYFWTEQNSGVTTQLTSALNINGLNAWICGYNGIVLRTINNGYNWQITGTGGIPNTATLVNIFGYNDQIALTAGYIGNNTLVFRTSNGGTNWTQVFSQVNGYINAIWMSSATNGFMVGNPVNTRWSLWKTTNGGVNWDSSGLFFPVTTSETGLNNSLWVNGSRIWFGTNASKVYYSSNNGTNWLSVQTPQLVSSYSIIFNNALTGFASGENMIKSTNSGFNWSLVTVPGVGIINTVVTDLYMDAAWFTRNDNNVYHSNNVGASWTLQYTAPSGNFRHMGISRSGFTGSGLVYGVRTNGGISRCNFYLEGVRIISNEIPGDFKLYQNYPNPFNPTTKIRFETPVLKGNHPEERRGYFVRLVIYNATGREIETMVDEIIQPGTYEDVWDGSKYSSGVYFYRLTYENPFSVAGRSVIFSISKKMVLIK